MTSAASTVILIEKSLFFCTHVNLLYINFFNKYQYNPNEVFGTLKQRFKEAYSSEGKSESEKVMDIFAEIDKCEYKVDFQVFYDV